MTSKRYDSQLKTAMIVFSAGLLIGLPIVLSVNQIGSALTVLPLLFSTAVMTWLSIYIKTGWQLRWLPMLIISFVAVVTLLYLSVVVFAIADYVSAEILADRYGTR